MFQIIDKNKHYVMNNIIFQGIAENTAFHFKISQIRLLVVSENCLISFESKSFCNFENTIFGVISGSFPEDFEMVFCSLSARQAPL